MEQARERSYHRALLLSKDKDTGGNETSHLRQQVFPPVGRVSLFLCCFSQMVRQKAVTHLH